MVGQFEMSVRHMLHEMEYLRNRVKEQEAVIQQIHRGFPVPGKPVYIHPADFAELVNNLDVKELVMFPADITRDTVPQVHTISGVRYVQTTAMPKISDKIK